MRRVDRYIATGRGAIVAIALLTICSGVALAQSSEQVPPDNGGSKAAARATYMYDRLTFPGGEIPPGARVRAWRQATEQLRLYAPSDKGGLMASNEWRNVGPHNIGGRIKAVAANPLNPSTIYIGAASGGIWRSYDEGRHWHSISDLLPTQAMGAIVIDPVDTAVVYAGTGEASYALNTFDGGGMFKSTDGGDTWREIGVGTLPPYGRASDMVIDPLNPSRVYAAIPDGFRDEAHIGIWRSTDAGETWTQVLPGRMNDIVIDPINPNILYTASSSVTSGRDAARYGVFKTTDGGDSWNALALPGVNDTLMGRTSIGICAARPEVLYLGVSTLSGNDRTPLLGVFKTTDAGASWRKLEVPFDYMVSQGWYDNIMGVHPDNPDIVYAGGVKLIFTTDGGESWTRVADQGYGGIVHVDQHAIDFNRQDPSIVYLGNDGGFFVGSGNGTAWEKRDLGLAITQFIGGAMHPSSDEVLFGGTQDNGTLLSESAPLFDLVLYGDGGNTAIDPRRPEVMYTTKETLKFYRSDDFGRTWTRMQNGMGLDRSLFYIDYAMDPSNPDILYLGTFNLYKTTDGAKSWKQAAYCPLGSGNSCYYISSVWVAPYDGALVLAGSNGGGVTISRDAAASFQRVPDGQLPAAWCSSVRTYRPGVLYATYSRYGVPKVWRSIDDGTTWTDISGNLPDVPVNDIIEVDGRLVIGTEIGTFISDNDGVDWQRLGTGMPSVPVFKLRYNPRSGTLRAITHGRGMYDMEWSTPAAAAPTFVSAPDTAAMEAGSVFTYAAVVDGSPAPAFRLLEAPSDATVDERLGVVRWVLRGEARFTLEAWNANGSARQVFTLRERPVSGVDWEIIQAHPFSTPVLAMMRAGDGSLWLARDSAKVMRSVDGGSTWTESVVPGSNAAVASVHAFDAQRVVVGTRDGRLMLSTDGGTSWSERLREVNASFNNVRFSTPLFGLAVTGDANRRDSAVVYVSRDGGEQWSVLAKTPARQVLENSLTMVGESNAWFASSNISRPTPAGPEIYRSIDGGVNWSVAAVNAQNISGLDFVDASVGFCSDDMSGVLRRSTNGGARWLAAFYPMGGERNVQVVTTTQPRAVWIVNDLHAWVSTDDGTTWTRTALVPAGPVQAAVFADSAQGWVVSKSGIVQRLRNSPLTSVRAEVVPGEAQLLAPYPNPVTGGVAASMLRYRLRTAAAVQLDVYNEAGVRVRSLVNGWQGVGEHGMLFESEGLPAGSYFVRMNAGTIQSVVRIVVLR